MPDGPVEGRWTKIGALAGVASAVIAVIALFVSLSSTSPSGTTPDSSSTRASPPRTTVLVTTTQAPRSTAPPPRTSETPASSGSPSRIEELFDREGLESPWAIAKWLLAFTVLGLVFLGVGLYLRKHPRKDGYEEEGSVPIGCGVIVLGFVCFMVVFVAGNLVF